MAPRCSTDTARCAWGGGGITRVLQQGTGYGTLASLLKPHLCRRQLFMTGNRREGRAATAFYPCWKGFPQALLAVSAAKPFRSVLA